MAVAGRRPGGAGGLLRGGRLYAHQPHADRRSDAHLHDQAACSAVEMSLAERGGWAGRGPRARPGLVRDAPNPIPGPAIPLPLAPKHSAPPAARHGATAKSASEPLTGAHLRSFCFEGLEKAKKASTDAMAPKTMKSIVPGHTRLILAPGRALRRSSSTSQSPRLQLQLDLLQLPRLLSVLLT